MKIIRNILVLLSSVIMIAAISSCKEKEEVTTITYGVTGSLQSSSQDIASQPSITDYTEAIQEVLGGYYATKEMDAEVVEACDKVYASHKSMIETTGISVKGSLELRKTVGSATSPDEELKYTVLKTYNY